MSQALENNCFAGQHVLLVDDDPLVLRSLRRWAQSEGLSVTSASDGAEALAALAGAPSVDAVITDVRMPRMDGPALAERLRAVHPGLPIVFISGYTGLEEPPDVRHRPRSTLVQKPFTLRALSVALCTVLAQ